MSDERALYVAPTIEELAMSGKINSPGWELASCDKCKAAIGTSTSSLEMSKAKYNNLTVVCSNCGLKLAKGKK